MKTATKKMHEVWFSEFSGDDNQNAGERMFTFTSDQNCEWTGYEIIREHYGIHGSFKTREMNFFDEDGTLATFEDGFEVFVNIR